MTGFHKVLSDVADLRSERSGCRRCSSGPRADRQARLRELPAVMGCGASAAAGSAYGAPAEPKVAREPLSEEQLQQLQQRVVRRMIGQALLAAWGS
eukprot:COSAG06_NODE_29841_length_549_cov_2.042222_1_plen_95_part_01